MTTESSKPFRIRRRQALIGMSVPLVVAALPAIAHASPLGAASPATVKSTYVYVNLNTAGSNTVAGFTRNTDGTLTALAGSPFTAGGAGLGTGLGSQGAIQVADNGKLLLVADAGSNQISVLRTHANGSLTAVAGSPFSSGGITPVSIAVQGKLVFVANQGNGGSNYTGFSLSATGALTPLPGATYALPDGSGVGEVIVDSTGKHLVGARVATSLIDSFTIGKGGALTAAPGNPIASQIPGPLGSAFKWDGSLQLFVSNAHGGALAGVISAYTVAGNGALSPVAGSPYADFQTAACWVTLSPDGKYLYTGNAGSDSISSYSIAASGALTLVSTTTLKGSGVGTFDSAFDPSGANLYQLEGNTSQISILSVSNGIMTELAASPVNLPTGGAPFGLVVTPVRPG